METSFTVIPILLAVWWHIELVKSSSILLFLLDIPFTADLLEENQKKTLKNSLG